MLAAIALAVAGLAAWAAVYVPHGEAETGLGRSWLLLALGCAASAAVAVAAYAGRRLAPAPALLAGAVTLGAGLLSSTVGVTTPGVLSALVPVAVGTGLLLASAPRFVAAGPGAATVAVAAASGVALAGLGSARAVFAAGGAAALAGALLLLRLEGSAPPALVRDVRRRAARFAAGTALLLGIAGAIHSTVLLEADKAAFEALHGLGATPELVETLLVEPSLRNYVIIVIAVSLLGARRWGRTTPGRTLLLVAGAGIVAYVGVRTCWALWERPRPEEVLAIDPGHSWAAFPSFPSGHVAVTTALALATATLVPKLRHVLWAYAVVIAFTRLAYGAHFPSDVLLGFALGWLAVRTTLRRSSAAA